MIKWQFLVLSLAISLLIACSSGNSAPRSSSNNFGQLESVESSITYSVSQLQHSVRSNVCFNLTVSSPECVSNLAVLSSNPNFNFRINQIQTQATAYKITYTAPGVYGEPRILSGAVIIPALPQSQIKGVILYYHGTEQNKQTVPSNFDPKLGGYYSKILGGIFASQGYIVVAPDYMGFGSDDLVLHPYMLYPVTNALSGIYMLRAARSYLNQLGFIQSTQPLNLYINGYSEGGLYTMWAAYLGQTQQQLFLQTNNFILKKATPTSGAYDILYKQLPFEYANIVIEPAEANIFNAAESTTVAHSKPVLTSYVLTAFATYTLNGESSSYLSLMLPNFFYLTGVNSPKPSDMYQLYNKSANVLTDEQISGIVNIAAESMINPDDGQLYSTNNNSIKAFYQPGFESDTLFLTTSNSASLYNWQTSIPIRLLYLKQDSLVTNLNSTEAYQLMHAQSGDLVTQFEMDNNDFLISNLYPNGEITPTDHPEAWPELMIAALTYFNQP